MMIMWMNEGNLPFLIAVEFEVEIGLEGGRRSVGIDLDRVVNYEIDRDCRVDLGRITSESLGGISHGGYINWFLEWDRVIYQGRQHMELQ